MIGFARARTIVETARSDDARVMSDIHEQGFRRGWSSDELLALLRDFPVVQGIVLRRVGITGRRRIAGFVLVRIAGGEAEILTVAVDPASRGRGYGRMLMEEALRRAYHDRADAVFLEVDAANAAAIALYRRLGFAQVGERPSYYREGGGPPGNALVMRLPLR